LFTKDQRIISDPRKKGNMISKHGSWQDLINAIHHEFSSILLFFSLIVFGGTEVPLFKFSSAASQRTAHKEMPSQMAAHQRAAVHCRLGRLLDLNPGLQFHNLVLLPMSHHCSHQ
jgi:hypothetical protein